jgi:hypothetical protein
VTEFVVLVIDPPLIGAGGIVKTVTPAGKTEDMMIPVMLWPEGFGLRTVISKTADCPEKPHTELGINRWFTAAGDST